MLHSPVGTLPEIAGGVVGDGVDPRRELRRRPVALTRPIDTQEHFLSEVLGGGMVAGVVEEERHETILPERHQLLEGRCITGLNAEHEVGGDIGRGGHAGDLSRIDHDRGHS